MEKQEERKSSLLDGWNVPPNLVTFSRIILVIVFLALYAKAGAWGVDNVTMRWVAAVIFIIAACTDKLDGWMARKYNQVTELGKLMDPIADKLLTCGTLIVAAIFNEFGNPVLGWVVTALFLIREIGITVMRFFVIDTPHPRQANTRRSASALVWPCSCCLCGAWRRKGSTTPRCG